MSDFLEAQQSRIDDQGKALEALTRAVGKLVEEDDEKIAEKMRPRADLKSVTAPIWVRRLSQSEETKVDEEADKALIDSAPGIEDAGAAGWLLEALGGATPEKGAVPK